MYSTILLCYDGSREGRLALGEGAHLARVMGASVHLLAVVETTSGSLLAQAADGRVLDHQQHDFQDILEEGRQSLAEFGLSADARLELGDPVASITRVARETAADLVVVGHHRHGVLARWLTRSVAIELSDSLDCSLLLAMSGTEDPAPPAKRRKP